MATACDLLEDNSTKILSISFNGNNKGNTSVCKSKEEHPLFQRHVAVRQMIWIYRPQIILVQESGSKISSIVTDYTLKLPKLDNPKLDKVDMCGIEYDVADERQYGSCYIGILYNKLKYRILKEYDFRKTIDSEIDRMKNDVEKQKRCLEVKGRLSAAVLESIEETVSETKLLVISYHGRKNKMTVENRLEDVKALFEIVQTIAQDLDIPYVIGGDFNLNLSDCTLQHAEPLGVFPEDMALEAHKSLAYLPNYLGPNQKKHTMEASESICHFVASEHIIPTLCEIISRRYYINIESNCELEINHVLDHDPIIVEFTDIREEDAMSTLETVYLGCKNIYGKNNPQEQMRPWYPEYSNINRQVQIWAWYQQVSNIYLQVQMWRWYQQASNIYLQVQMWRWYQQASSVYLQVQMWRWYQQASNIDPLVQIWPWYPQSINVNQQVQTWTTW